MVTGTAALAPMDARAEAGSAAEFAAALIHNRRTVLPKRLAGPGPDAAQLARILDAAAAAPDHGQLLPWRFVLVPAKERERLADVFALALQQRDPKATQEQLAQAREKAFRAPTLLLAIARVGLPTDEIPAAERLVSAGCAIQNMLLMATALGFGSALTSGKALQSRPLRELFGLATDEQALCFLSIGTVSATRPPRPRPASEHYVSELGRRK
jgi:nitroreductase